MNPSKALRTTTAKMIPASIHTPIISLMNPAASSTYIRMLLNCEKNLVNGPRLRPSGKRLGPYFSSRAEASDGSRPVSELVTSRVTTSACDMACQAATSVTVFVPTVVFMSRSIEYDTATRFLTSFWQGSSCQAALCAHQRWQDSRQQGTNAGQAFASSIQGI